MQRNIQGGPGGAQASPDRGRRGSTGQPHSTPNSALALPPASAPDHGTVPSPIPSLCSLTMAWLWLQTQAWPHTRPQLLDVALVSSPSLGPLTQSASPNAPAVAAPVPGGWGWAWAQTEVRGCVTLKILGTTGLVAAPSISKMGWRDSSIEN